MTRATPSENAGDSGAAGRLAAGMTLVYCNGLERAGEQVSLARRATLLIGCEERIFPGGPLDDPKLGERHAALTHNRGRWTLVDRGSKHGTSVNGARVTEHMLSDGDVLRLGSTFMVFGRLATRPRSLMLNSVGAAMAKLEESVALVARTDHTVLILGERGTGKELVAHELHRLSGRSGPLLAVNCAALHGELLASELFGDGHGLLLRATNGTVFLDEAGELDEAVQAELLRVLETRAVRSGGTSEEIPVGTRVIAATHREAATLVSGKHLRQDLYARLARWTITAPSLRERREDLGILTRVLLARSAARLDVTPDFMAALLAAEWPSNVRGLVNVLAGAYAAQPRISRLDLVREAQEALEAEAHATQAQEQPASSQGPHS